MARFKTKMNPIIVHNIWTLEYTRDLFHFVTVPPTITLERGIRYFDTEAGVCAEISRRIVCQIGRELGSIMFEVECTLAEFGNSRYFFIMIEEVEGAMSIVDVLRVYRPKGLRTDYQVSSNLFHSRGFATHEQRARHRPLPGPRRPCQAAAGGA